MLNKTERRCKRCGKVFLKYLCDVENGRGVFCSRECHNIWRSEHVRGRKHPLWLKLETKCIVCGTTFYVKPSQLKRGKGKFCSLECKASWQSKRRREDHPRWKGGKTELICPTCGKTFSRAPAHINGKIAYCSNRCARQSQIFPTHHTKPELIFEEICKKHNLHFKYTGDGSLWIGKKGEGQLNPDFIQADGEKVIVEIMGDYWHSPLLNRKMHERGTLTYRKKHYKRFKWDPIFIWESDLKRKDAEQFVLRLLSL